MLSDSSTVVVRSIGAVLKGEEFDPFMASGFERIGATICNNLPRNSRKSLMEYLSGLLGCPMSFAGNVRSRELESWAVNQYPKREYDAVIVGAPSGGAAHLGSLLGAPFLTQHFLLAFKGRFPIDDSTRYLAGCEKASRTIVENNPDVHVIIHYDPIHDRFLVKGTGFIRIKLLNFPGTYRDFIASRLKKNGAIILLGCRYPWKQYRIAERISYQLGGLGGVTPDEFYAGSERIAEFISRERSVSEKSSGGQTHSGWLLDGYPLEETPESEWGLIESFAEDVKSFASERGFGLIEINLNHPDELSTLMFKAFGKLISSEHPNARPLIFMDSFTNSSPSFNRKVSARPLWLPFICDDSYDYAVKILDREPAETEILLALHPTFCDPFDLTPLEKWMKYLARFRKVTLVGVDPGKYPADLTSYFTFSDDLKRYEKSNPGLLIGKITPAELTSIIQNRMD